MKDITILLLLTLPLALSVEGQSQSAYNIQRFGTKDGLGFEFARRISQDSLGYIWIHHGIGASRYDGHAFRFYKEQSIDSTSGLGVTLDGQLLKDKFGNIWIHNLQVTAAGRLDLYKYDFQSDNFVKFDPDLSGATVNKVSFPDTEPVVWLAGANGGLFRYDLKSLETKNYLNAHPTKETQIQQNSIRDLKDYGSFLLLATRRGLWKFHKLNGSFSRPKCSPADSAFLYSSVIDRIMDKPNPENHNDVWLRVQKTFLRIDSTFAVTQRFELPEGITWNMNAWDRTKDGVFWFAGNGLRTYDPRNNSFRKVEGVPGSDQTIHSTVLNDVFIDRDQNVWVSTWFKGVYKISKPDLHFHNFMLGEEVSSTIGYRTKELDRIMITRRDRLRVDQIQTAVIDPKRLDTLHFENLETREPITARVRSSWLGKTTYWLSTLQGVIGMPYNSESGAIKSGPMIRLMHDPGNANTISSNVTSGVWEDTQGSLWVGTYGSGLNKVNVNLPYGTDGSVERFKHIAGDSASLSNDVIWWEFCQETENSFWVITASGADLFENGRFSRQFRDTNTMGLLKPSTDSLLIVSATGYHEGKRIGNNYTFKSNPRLKGKFLNAIQFDQFGRLWSSTLGGLIFYDPHDELVIEFTEREGVGHARDWMYKTMSGILVLANADGVTLFDPGSFVVSRKATLPVLHRLEVNNKPVHRGRLQGDDEFFLSSDIGILEVLTLDYQYNNFSVEFSAMEMNAPEKNLYRHKLEGYDLDWIETNYLNRTARYTSLPDGAYTLRVQASNHHGVWSDKERKLTVVILPPPWRTWWAYAGYWALGAGLLVLARRMVVQRERLKSNLKLAKVEQEKEHFELEKAKEVDRVKTSFFTNISHEFRTPLTLIKGPVERLMEEFGDNPKVKERLKLVQRNSDLLLRLINQLLDLAKLESGTLKVEKSEGEVYSFVRAVASTFDSFARQKNITLETEVPEGAYPAMFDKDKVETILINLINNAVKFTPSGGTIKVQAEAVTGQQPITNSQQLSLVVSDTGIGIPNEQQSKIFERFHQVSEAHKEVGTGIGLSLVKELVALMGGEISVKSEPGKGSEFTITIPVEITVASVAEMSNGAPKTQHPTPNTQHLLEGISNIEHRTPNDEVDQSKPQVLVVEDNSDLRLFIIDSLGTEFHFLQAENGKQGLDTATEQIPDLIISDVMMPEMDGMEMAAKIKGDIKTSHIPLIMLTAKSGEESKLAGLRVGADDYLTKPFNKEELLLKVRNGVARQQKMRERLRAELLSSAPKVEVMSEDEKFLNTVKEKILERMSDEQLSVESLADDIGMSRVQLYRKVSGLTGMAVNELIRKLRLQRAAQLLGQQWGPVSQVAYEVGFSNLSYFSKVFKEEFGVLPSEYEEV